MKKANYSFVSVILIFTIIVGLFSFQTAAEETVEGNTPSFSVGTSFVKDNDNTKISINVSENSKICAGLFRVKYDTTKIKATAVNLGVVLKNGSTSVNITNKGYVMVAYANTSPIFDGGKLFEIEFVSVNSMEIHTFEDVTVELEVLDLKDYDDKDIKFIVNNGRITLINTKYGDVNGSGTVTAVDSLLTLYSASKLADLSEAEFIRADVNGDLKISPADALLILRFSVGDISDFPLFNLKAPDEIEVTDKTETEITIQWTAVANAVGYNLYVNNKKKNDIPIVLTSTTIDDLVQDTVYSIEIRSVNALKESDDVCSLNVSTNKADRTVVFKDYDGTIISQQIVKSGNDAVEPIAPSRKGYTFTGWDKPTKNIIKDSIITATYSINKYKVVIDYADGSDVSECLYDYNSKIEKPESKERNDYTLEGWYQDKTYTKPWSFDSDYVADDLTLYAKWVTWSEWVTELPAGIDSDKYIIESRQESRNRTKSTTSSTSSSLSGWTKYNSAITGWGNWSSWQRNAISSSESRQVDSQWIAPTYKTVYCYYHWISPSYRLSSYAQYDSTYYYESCERDSPMARMSQYDQAGHYCYGSFPYSNMWWDQSTKQVQTGGGYTQYRYRDAQYTYYYYKWSDWSNWSTEIAEGNESTEVQTRTVYRYLLKGE